MILDIILLALAVLLCMAVLLQARGASLGIAFGGDGNVYRTRRGIEKKLHVFTVILAVLFLVTAIVNALFSF